MEMVAKTKQTHRVFQVELATSRRLGLKLQQLLWKKMPNLTYGGFEFALAYVLFLRAERTFASIRTLAQARNVDDAMALVRVMVEKVINAEYILLAGSETAIDYIQYFQYRSWRDFEELQAISPELAPKYSPAERQKRMEAYESAKVRKMPDGTEKKRFGRGHDWIEIGLSERSRFVDQQMADRLRLRTFRSTQILYQMAYKKSAGYLHGTWVSIARSLESMPTQAAADEHGMTELQLGIKVRDRDVKVASDAMNQANLTAMAMFLFIVRIFDQKPMMEWASKFTAEYRQNLRDARRE
jgi:hypothetical protein